MAPTNTFISGSLVRGCRPNRETLALRSCGVEFCGSPVRDIGINHDVSRNTSAMLNFAPHPVEASIARPFVTVLPALTGRADARNASLSA